MKGYVQMNPFNQKAYWWKKHEQKQTLGKVTIFTATPNLGYEVDSMTNQLKVCQLISGQLKTLDSVEYIPITEVIDGLLVATKAIKLNKKLYVFNVENQTLEEVDVAYDLERDVELEVFLAETSNISRFDKAFYVKKRRFDCTEDSDLQEGSYQPIGGLFADSSHLSIKTQNFGPKEDMPKHGDIITYDGIQWMVDEVNKTYSYNPKKRLTLHLALKALK